MFSDISVAKEKIATKISLEPPESIHRNRHQVNQFERLSTSFFWFDSVYNLLFAEQFRIIGFSVGRMNRHTNEAIQKNEGKGA